MTTHARMATDPQVGFIKSLLAKKVLPDGALERAEAKLEAGITMREASEWIDWLKKRDDLPKPEADSCVPQPEGEGTHQYYGAYGPGRNPSWRVEYEDVVMDDGKERRIGKVIRGEQIVPAGTYALETPEDPVNNIKFYRLWIGDRFGWRIYMIAGPEQHEASRTFALDVMDRIAADPGEAAKRYGLLIGKCGICNRRLSRQSSRELGIGPVCAKKWGWD